MKKSKTARGYFLNTAVIVILFTVFQIITASLGSTSGFKLVLAPCLWQCCYLIILAASLNLVLGFLGQLSLGHCGFMAIGAYAAALISLACERAGVFEDQKGAAFILVLFGCILAAGLLAALIGLLLGIPALRLKGDYLAIITLGFGEIIRVVLLNIDSVLGFKLTYGAASLKNIPKETDFLRTYLCVGIVCFLIHTMMKSRHGRAILSVRENEIAAESCGINLTFYKTLGFTASAFFAGVAGALYASYLGILNPSGFGFMKSIEILVMVVLGGMGSMLGSILSATVLTILPELLRSFSDYRMVVYSLALVVMMIFRPKGLLGSYDFSLSRSLEKFLNRLTGRTTKTQKEAAENE